MLSDLNIIVSGITDRHPCLLRKVTGIQSDGTMITIIQPMNLTDAIKDGIVKRKGKTY